MCTIGINTNVLVEQCPHDFGKQPGCVLIGECGLIRMNTVQVPELSTETW